MEQSIIILHVKGEVMNNEQYWNSDTMVEYPSNIHSSVKLGKNVTIGMNCILEEGVVVGDDCFIGHHVLVRPNTDIGNGVGIRAFCLIDPDVIIGDDCQIYPYSVISGGTILGKNVYYGAYTVTANSSAPGVIVPPIIEDNAIIYACCKIAPGVSIGKGAVLGMGSIITKDVPPMQMWYGEASSYKRDVTKKDFNLGEEDSWPSSMLDYIEELNRG
jgi:UDP-3-O-[3-hydroxymyristoyl] glucosamine N-acyltransferase